MNLTATFSDPPLAATALALAATFAIGQVWAAAAATLIASGLAWTGHPWLCALITVAMAVAWLIDSARYPRRDCLWCKGAGKYKKEFLFFTTSKECRHCDGAGRKARLGARVLTRAFGDHFL